MERRAITLLTEAKLEASTSSYRAPLQIVEIADNDFVDKCLLNITSLSPDKLLYRLDHALNNQTPYKRLGAKYRSA